MNNTGEIFERLLHLALVNDISIKFTNFKSASEAMIHNDRIGVSQKLGIKDINYNLAHELSHFFLHYDKGNTFNSDKHDEYEEQADRGARMLLTVLQLCVGEDRKAPE